MVGHVRQIVNSQCWSWCVQTGKTGNVKLWVTLIRVKLWRLDDWSRAPPKRQVLWCVPGIQGSVPTKRGSRRDKWWIDTTVMGAQGSLMLGEQRVAHLNQSHRRATVPQIAEKCIAGHDQQVITVQLQAVDHADFCKAPTMDMWVLELDPRHNWRRWIGLINHFFFYIMWKVVCLCIIYLGRAGKGVRCMGVQPHNLQDLM